MPLQHSFILYLVKCDVYRLDFVEFTVHSPVVFLTAGGRRLAAGRRRLRWLLLFIDFRADFLHGIVQRLRGLFDDIHVAALHGLTDRGDFAFNVLV